VIARVGFIVAAGATMAGAVGLYTGIWALAAVLAGGCCLLGGVIAVNEYRHRWADEAAQPSGK
jgi:4-hydroxybenzoate polyprenyltransferase